MGAVTGRDPWLRRFAPRPDAPARLVCFPHAGGAATAYAVLARSLAPDGVDVVAVQPPGRQDRISEAPAPDLHAMADAVTAALLAAPGPAPVLFGHSMGSFVAYEVTRRLEAAGAAPVRLVVSARRAPSTMRGEDAHTRGDAALIAHLRTLGGPGSELLDNPSIREIVLPSVRADYTALAAHPLGDTSSVDTPITAFAPRSDPRCTVEEMHGWAAHTRGGFDLREFPGGHFYLGEHADLVREALLDVLGTRRGDEEPSLHPG